MQVTCILLAANPRACFSPADFNIIGNAITRGV
jgi:hypothetical protein